MENNEMLYTAIQPLSLPTVETINIPSSSAGKYTIY